MTERRFTPREIAESRGVSIDTVRSWIASGQLRATNLARAASSKKPRWRVSESDLAAFEAARSNSPQPKPQRRRRRTGPPVREYV
ncbi:MAG: helix-turn-helix domain-containing protein [Planctomycetes bacterium]|nr:helix-turn-helix domain-containing protein [Planctomycetota bacterium]